LPVANVDTDQIIPAEYLKVTGRSELGEGLFAAWRADPSFVLNRPEHRGATILLADENFGCGSSREHAVWALADYGFSAVIAPGFADIFRNNALKNGVVPVAVSRHVAEQLFAHVAADPSFEATVDLAASLLTLPDGERVAFEVDPFARRCLLDGADPLDLLLAQGAAIAAWEAGRPPRVDTGERAD
jgi:3-isopropylmalate/(R)-2-methylmalate dehydratase small subunit